MNAPERAMRFGRLGIEPLPRGYGPPRRGRQLQKSRTASGTAASIAQSAARPRLKTKSRPIAEFVPCLAGQRHVDALATVCVTGHRRWSVLT